VLVSVCLCVMARARVSVSECLYVCNVVEQVVALYKYQRQNADELSFEKGCVINVINKLESDWWTGELNGQTGVFPSNYVAPLSSVSDFDQLSASATCELYIYSLICCQRVLSHKNTLSGLISWTDIK